MDIQKPEIICHLDELMQQRGLTQQQLSEETGIAPAGIRAYQHNSFRRIDRDTLATIAGYFKLRSLDELFTFVYKE
ncbi:helix-turn-helix domain-containing protein [Phormidium sp. CCY1219]|uniref:helix-turn-helix domain-containing protein n=1 Tax=Phormidium sp. CCY1219 TaxID=2886104 RepID=UPI002D1F5A2F|nr:helix-turn-helix transcriptional regulator [Phormidium sp. CCY1219]MEB3828857.1 helix-turn-helix transcriptional regulator [Phormidium sp. CCY1219]